MSKAMGVVLCFCLIGMTEVLSSRENEKRYADEHNSMDIEVTYNGQKSIAKNYGIYSEQDLSKRDKRNVPLPYSNVTAEDCQNMTDHGGIPNSLQMQCLYRLHSKFCFNVPLCQTKHDSAKYPPETCCEVCSCDRNCRESKMCCPDAPGVEFKPYDQNATCERSSYFGKRNKKCEIPKKHYMMTKVCHRTNTNKTLDKLCRSDNPISLIQHLPVSSVDGMSVYRNAYCALCNHETNYISWDGQIMCNDEKPFLSTTISGIETELHYRYPFCNMNFVPAQNLKATMCNDRKIISSCNVTGLWRETDEFIEKSCKSYTAVYEKFPESLTFQNIFCVLCNGMAITPNLGTCNDRNPDLCSGKSFSALLNLQDAMEHEDVEEGSQCSAGDLYDKYTKTCRQVRCHPPLSYVTDSCVSIYDDIVGLKFDLFIRISAADIFETCFGCCSAQILEHAFSSTENLTKGFQEFQRASQFVFYKSKTFDTSVQSFQVIDILLNYKITSASKYDIETYKEKVSSLLSIDSTEARYEDYTRTLRVDGRKYTTVLVGDNDALMDHSDGSIYFSCFSFPKNLDSEYLRVTDTLLCPFVNISKQDWSLTHEDSGVCFIEVGICLKSNEIMESDNYLFLCKERYGTIVSKRIAGRRTSFDERVQNILSVICVSISITSLFVTLVTYCLLKELRKIPGLNIMALSLSMLIAYVLTAIGQNGLITGIGCAICGFFIHFFWLHTFAWMNICCIHIYRTMCRLQIENSVACPRYLFYHLYTFVVAVVFVSINIGREFDGMTYFGYSQTKCYISKASNILLTIILPLAVILFVNIVLFTVVVVKIRRTSDIQKHAQNSRNNLFIFVKLSTFTGMSWIFGFLHASFEKDIFSYLFIIFGGLQGLFVMLAFVVNKRVLNLYRALLLKKQNMKNQSTVRSSTKTSDARL